ncbi:MAG: TadE/TadG family type IV pilus assembly protein [Rhizomicrobium sp.]|jgi:Flp pilus assembly protein TadG
MSSGKVFRGLVARAARRARVFASAKRGNVAMIYALALIPLCLATGAGLDYARAIVVRSGMEEAIDAAALAVGSTTGLTAAQMQTLAQQYFNANYKMDSSYGTPTAITVVPSGQSVTITVTDQMPTTLVSVVGIKTLAISASTKVVWGQLKLRVALVLDNTGSMCEPDNQPCTNDNNSNIKINALKTATTNLLSMLKGVAVNAGDVTIAIVPFTTGVNVGTANKNASWLTYVPWDATGSGYGSYQNSHGNSCTKGTYGCNWVATDSDHSTWTGCVMDRNQDYDVQNTLPATGTTATLFPAAPAGLYSQSNWSLTCPTKLIGMTDVLNSTGWSNLNTTVSNMTAGGATNQAIGLAWGWMLMTSGSPIVDPGALPANTQQVIILLSDGLNTQDRWTGSGSSQDSGTDARMNLVCSNAKAAGITIYAVFVDLNGTQGNSTVLQNCATDSSKYFDLTSAGAIVTAFNQIGQQITNLRVAQ